MSNLDAAIGARARALRKASGLSLKEFVRDMDISVAYLSELERGEKRWSAERIQQVAEMLEVSPILLQDDSIPLDRIREVADILNQLSEIPQDKLAVVAQLLQALRS